MHNKHFGNYYNNECKTNAVKLLKKHSIRESYCMLLKDSVIVVNENLME